MSPGGRLEAGGLAAPPDPTGLGGRKREAGAVGTGGAAGLQTPSTFTLALATRSFPAKNCISFVKGETDRESPVYSVRVRFHPHPRYTCWIVGDPFTGRAENQAGRQHEGGDNDHGGHLSNTLMC